jgi:hypothetical protein
MNLTLACNASNCVLEISQFHNDGAISSTIQKNVKPALVILKIRDSELPFSIAVIVHGIEIIIPRFGEGEDYNLLNSRSNRSSLLEKPFQFSAVRGNGNEFRNVYYLTTLCGYVRNKVTAQAGWF